MVRYGAVLLAAMLIAPAAHADSNPAQDAQTQVDGAAGVVKQAAGDPNFMALFKQAKGAYIVPNATKGAFIAGGEGGTGVLVANRNGTWNGPAFLNLSAISIGAQVGGKSGPIVMLLMTDKASHAFSQAHNLSVGANAGFTIVNYSERKQAPAGTGDIIVWSNQSGAFAGASVSGTDITPNGDENTAYYGKAVTTADILDGQVHNPQAEPLLNALPR